MTFELQYTDSKSDARACLIKTDHGDIKPRYSCLSVRAEV